MASTSRTFWSLLLATSIIGPVWAEEPAYKRCQFYRGIAYNHTITFATEADLDADGSKEVLVGYREPGEAVNQQGGLLILVADASGCSIAWHAFFENVYAKKVTANGGTLNLELVQTTMQQDRSLSYTLVKGKDYFFRKESGSPFFEVKTKASSTLKKDGISPDNVMDDNLKTAWAEGAEGTGVDESFTIEFKKPVDLGLIGMLHGNYLNQRSWRDNNRLHRAEATVETASDRFDADSAVDFQEDLGLGMYGDRVELSFSNKPVMRYEKLMKRSVVSVEVKITSVLLGEKNDDTYVAEVDFAELLTSDRILGTEKKEGAAKKEGTKEAKPAKEEKSDDWSSSDDDGF